MSNWAIDVTEAPYNAGNGNDDTAAIAQAIVDAAGKKRVLLPAPACGFYLVKSGPIVVSTPNTVIEAATNGVILSAGGVDNTLLRIEADEVQIENLLIQGKGTPFGYGETTFGATQPAMTVAGNPTSGSTSFDMQLRSVSIQGGSICLQNFSSELKLDDVHMAFAYGAALLYTGQDPNGPPGSKGGSIFGGSDVFLDNNWDPHCGGGPPMLVTVAAWAPNIEVSAQQLIEHPAGYVFQCLTAGITGSSPPSPANYRVNMPDGSAVWRLACPTSLAAFLVNSGASEIYMDRLDMTGAAANGMLVTNTLPGGVPPQMLRISKPISSQTLNTSINLEVGSALYITDPEIASQVQNSANGITVGGGWSGRLSVRGGFCYGNSWGILNAGGSQAVFDGIDLLGIEQGAFFSNVGGFNLVNNMLTGPQPTSINAPPGFYNVANNLPFVQKYQ